MTPVSLLYVVRNSQTQIRSTQNHVLGSRPFGIITCMLTVGHNKWLGQYLRCELASQTHSWTIIILNYLRYKYCIWIVQVTKHIYQNTKCCHLRVTVCACAIKCIKKRRVVQNSTLCKLWSNDVIGENECQKWTSKIRSKSFWYCASYLSCSKLLRGKIKLIYHLLGLRIKTIKKQI